MTLTGVNNSITFGWNEKVGDPTNGSTVQSFVYMLNGVMFSTSASSVTLAATNGVSYSVQAAIKNVSNQVGGYSAALSVVPVGQPSISSVCFWKNGDIDIQPKWLISPQLRCDCYPQCHYFWRSVVHDFICTRH